MDNKKRIFFLLLIILFFSGVLLFMLDRFGIVQAVDIFPFLKDKNALKIVDAKYPTEVEFEEFKKAQDKMQEWEEALAKKDEKLKVREEQIEKNQKDIEELKENLKAERKRLKGLAALWNDREKKVKDLSSKVRNMPPIDATKMMENWPDFDVIDVLRQVDVDAETEGVATITPYLLTLFTPKRRAEITRKMLLPPLEIEND